MLIIWTERQVNELNSAPAATPATPSNLTAPPIEADESGASAEGRGTEEEKT